MTLSDTTILSTDQAINILQNSGLGELKREHAVSYLQEHPTAEAIDALVTGLDDDDYIRFRFCARVPRVIHRVQRDCVFD